MAESLISLYPYQRRWLADRSRFKAAMVTRQGGKTKYMAAIEVIEDCLEAEARGERTRWIWLSRGERQAAEAMEEGLKPLCRIYGAAFEALDYVWEADSQVRCKATEIVFPRCGSRITALPSNPDTARGFTANVVLDEFAIHHDSRKIWASLFPSVSRKGLRLRVLSTPNGRDNKFYEIMTGKNSSPAVRERPGRKDPWSRHVVDIYQAVADGLDRDIEELRSACGDHEIWAQEYELKFLDEATAWLGYDLIAAVEHPEAGAPHRYAGNPCFVGNDIAARGDLWVAWVWEAVGDVLWTREIRELRGASFAEHDAAIAELMARYRVARLAMDQTGMGEKPVEDARRRYPGRDSAGQARARGRGQGGVRGTQGQDSRRMARAARRSAQAAQGHRPDRHPALRRRERQRRTRRSRLGGLFGDRRRRYGPQPSRAGSLLLRCRRLGRHRGCGALIAR